MPEKNPLSSSQQSGQTHGLALGLDLGKHHLRLGLLNEAGALLDFRRLPYEFDRQDPASGQLVLQQIVQASQQLMAEKSEGQPLTAIGVALPGLIHHPTQQIVKLPHLPALAELDVRATLGNQFKVPVTLINNAQAATFAEMQSGCARGVSDWLYLHIGANVSAGLVLGGQLQYGKSGLAGALGEMTIDPERTGELVSLESMVSAEDIVRRTQQRLFRDNTSSLSRLALVGGFTYNDIITAADAGDELARLMLGRTGKFIGLAICEIISLLNISLIAVGGAPNARPYLVPAIAEEAKQHTHPAMFDDCQIIAAALDAEATVIGAALLAQQ